MEVSTRVVFVANHDANLAAISVASEVAKVIAKAHLEIGVALGGVVVIRTHDNFTFAFENMLARSVRVIVNVELSPGCSTETVTIWGYYSERGVSLVYEGGDVVCGSGPFTNAVFNLFNIPA